MQAAGKISKAVLTNLKTKVGGMTAEGGERLQKATDAFWANLKIKIGGMKAEDGGDRNLKNIWQKVNDAYKSVTKHRTQLTHKRIQLPFQDLDYPELVPPVSSISENFPYYLLVIPAIAATAFCVAAYQISVLIYLASRFGPIVYGDRVRIK